MTRPGRPRQRSPSPATSASDAVRVVPGPGPAVVAAALSGDSPRVHGVIDFLDRRWSTAEADAAAARRSLLLLLGVVLGVAVVAMSIAAAVAGFVVVLLVAQDLLGLETAHLAASVLATVGASGATVAVYHRLGRRR